ncbi:MAG: hypothetical protein AAFR03_03690 [Pseudomonadota bacterium]
MSQQFLDTEAAFALRAKQLAERLYDQMADALPEKGLRIASKTMGIVQLLYSEGSKSQADIAGRLRYSHQLTAQRLAWLYEHEFAVSVPDENDARRRIIQLTASGLSEGKKLQSFLPELTAAYEALFTEIGINLDAAIQKADQALDNNPLKDRMANSPGAKRRVK